MLSSDFGFLFGNRCTRPCSVKPTEFEFALRALLFGIVAVAMVTTGQEIVENKIAQIITQSLAGILVEAEMLTGQDTA